MTTAAKITPPLKWHGGKNYLAKAIIGMMPPRCKNPNKPDPGDPGWLHYVEPFFGGGAVLLAQDPEGISEVANDLNGELINFWKIIQHAETFADFGRAVEAVPFSQPHYGASELPDGPGISDVGRAVNFFIYCRQSMSGRMDSFAPLTRNRTRRGMNEQVSAWLNSIDGLPAVHARLKRVVILNSPAVKVIKQQDGPRTLFYCDPPYVHNTRVTTGEYKCEMTDADHLELLRTLKSIEGRFLLSGYDSDLYHDFAREAGWACDSIEIDNKASSKKSKDKERENIWRTFA